MNLERIQISFYKMIEALKCNPQKVLMIVFSTMWRKPVYSEIDEKSQHTDKNQQKKESRDGVQSEDGS